MEHHLSLPDFLVMLVAMLGGARLFGWLARKVGQPAVLGELIAGVVVGKSVLGLVDPGVEVVHLMAELGVIILLFTIGLETDLRDLIRVGPTSLVVAIVGVVAPFALGYGVAMMFGATKLVAIVIGASMTATSVGITARVLSDLGRLQSPESQVVLGAAILDDVIGLVILSLVATLAGGKELSPGEIGKTTALAFGFLIVVIGVGRLVVPPIVRWLHGVFSSDNAAMPAFLMALLLAFAADKLGSAVILGAFAGGMLLVGSPQHHEIEVGVTRLGHFFVPIFFVSVGAAVDLSVINPANAANLPTLGIAGVLIVVAVLGKFVSGYAPWWFKGRKEVIGVGMIPRGEVGLIFAQMGHRGPNPILSEAQFAAVTIVVMASTFIAPPLLKMLLANEKPTDVGPKEEMGIGDLTYDEA